MAELHLVKVPFRADGFAGLARARGLAVRDLDDGYLAHCALRELWQEAAPAPFVLRGRGRAIEVWGYAPADAVRLQARARTYADPSLSGALESIEAIASRPVPRLSPGAVVGFHLKACPIVRLSSGRGGHRAGAELDAFLAECLRVGPEVVVSREAVYLAWLAKRFEDPARTGVKLARAAVAASTRERLVRRTQGEARQARRLERPEVCFEGELEVTNPDLFLELMARGVGRHRAFGFGALMLVPPGTAYPGA